MAEKTHQRSEYSANNSAQGGDLGGPGKGTMVDVNNGGRRMARGTGPQGSVFGNGVPWARGSSPEIARPAGKDSASAKSIESPLNNAAVSDAGANAGAAIQKSTMRPGGIAEQGFAGTAGALPFQSEMEQSFGRDLSGVKVYADANAKLATEKLGAEAYVMGDRIAFNTAAPDRKTVAHELTHVLQHTGAGGARPANGETDSRGLDMAGEHEAEAVESAIAGGKKASAALSGAAPSAGARSKKGGPARKAEGGGFSAGLKFTPDAFRTGVSHEMWKGGPYVVPTPCAAVSAKVTPSVSITCEQGVNWDAAEESDIGLVLSIGVSGTVAVALAAGQPLVADISGGLAASVTGSFTYTLNKDTWTLAGGLSLSSTFFVGVSVAGGILNYSFEFGAVDPIATLAGIQWQNGNFSAGAFEWGPVPQAAFGQIQQAADQGSALIGAGVELGKNGVEAAQQTFRSAEEWTTESFDKVMGGAGAIIDGAAGAVGDGYDAVSDTVGDVLSWRP